MIPSLTGRVARITYICLDSSPRARHLAGLSCCLTALLLCLLVIWGRDLVVRLVVCSVCSRKGRRDQNGENALVLWWFKEKEKETE